MLVYWAGDPGVRVLCLGVLLWMKCSEGCVRIVGCKYMG